MSFLSSLVAWQWAVLAVVPVGIVVLYFLKLKRQPVEVPSTFLWARTIEDLHVNSLLQRLRSSFLLFLQLLAVAIAAFALLRPGYRDDTKAISRRIFLLDTSASMGATDVGADGNRFESARKKIGEAIEAMTDRESAMLMTVNERADVLQAFTSDRRRLREALASAQLTNRMTKLDTALRAAYGLTNQANPIGTRTDADTAGNAESRGKANEQIKVPTELVLYSDGGFTTPTDVALDSLNLRYESVGGKTTKNLAIVAMSAQRIEPSNEDVELFATIANLGTEAASSSVSLSINGELADADQVSLEPGDETGVTFQLKSQPLLRMALSIDNSDDLLVDNRAFTALAPLRTVSVLLVTPDNKPLELALSTGEAAKLCVVEVVPPSYLSSEAYKARSTTGMDELIIYDRCQPSAMPATNTFFVGSLPPSGWTQRERSSQVLLVDIDRSHPIMRYLDLFSLLIAEGNALVPPPGAVDLLVGDTGPILSIGPREGFEDLVLGFEIMSATADGGASFNTDWQVQRSWPVFVLNAIRYLTGVAEVGGQRSHHAGEVVTLSTDRRQGELSIRIPSGSIQFVKPDSTGRVTFTGTESTGVYEVEDEKRVVDLFSVNLFDRRESTLAVSDVVQLGDQQLSRAIATTASRREYWRILLFGLLGVLTFEWWYYVRRLG